MSKQNPEISYTLAELADILSASLVINNSSLDSNHRLNEIATLDKAELNNISFYTNTKYRESLLNSNAGVVITTKKNLELVKNAALVVANPHQVYATLAKLLKYNGSSSIGIHATAIVGKNCKISEHVIIGPYVVIGDNVTIESDVEIQANCTIGDNCSIGSGTLIYSRVSLYSSSKIGSNCIIHSGAVIGSDGFGFALGQDKVWHKVEQLGGVTIGNNVEVGANTTIDCGAIDDTVISDGVKLDNQIQVAHNVVIGEHSIFAAKTVIAGSSKIGKYCGIGGASTIAGHITLADGVNLAGACVAAKSIDKPGIYASGTGSVMPFSKWRRMIVNLSNLDKYIAQLKELRANIKNKDAVDETSA